MFKPTLAVAALIAACSPALAATDYPKADMRTTLPKEAWTVTDWYKQNVYDPNENKIGDIKDVLVDKSGEGSGTHRCRGWLFLAQAKRTLQCPLKRCIRR